MNTESLLSRRRLLRGGLAFGAAMYCLPGAFAEELSLTPRLTEGPFYPDKLPLDKDNDLIIIGDSTTPAVGQITHLTGRILDRDGKPGERKACGHRNLASRCPRHLPQYPRQRPPPLRQEFSGLRHVHHRVQRRIPFPHDQAGPLTSGRTGFNIHFRVNRHGREVLTTQAFIEGFQQNSRDGVLRGIRRPAGPLCSGARRFRAG